MTAGLLARIVPSGTDGLYELAVMVDDFEDVWDRVTVDGTPAEVTLAGVPTVTYGEPGDLEAGADVLPSYATVVFEDPDGGVAAWFRQYRDDEGALLVRYRSLLGGGPLGAFEWYGRVRAAGGGRPVNRATADDGRVSVEISCGLGDGLAGVLSAPTEGFGVADLAAELCFDANPHLPLRVLLDVSAEGQAVDGSGYTSGRELRAAGEWAGRSFVAEGSGATPEAADGDYGELREVLDKLAKTAGLRVYQDFRSGEWHVVPRTMLGEAMPGAERAVYASPDPAWDAPGTYPLAAREWSPEADDVRDESGDAVDEVPRLASVTMDAGVGNMVRPPFPYDDDLFAYAGGAGWLDTGETQTQALLVVAPEADTYAVVDLVQEAVSSERTGFLRLRLEGFDGVTYWLDTDGTWATAAPGPTDYRHGYLTSPYYLRATELFPATGRLHADAVEGSDSHPARWTFFGVALADGTGAVKTQWRFSIGAAETGGDREEAEPAPPMEFYDGSTWAEVTAGYASARWGASTSFLAEYGAQAALRLRASRLDALDGAVHALVGPGTRLLLDVIDMDGQVDRQPFLCGGGLEVDPDTGWTRGVWHRLPPEALPAE